MSTKSFEIPIKVVQDDIDILGHVSNIVYVKWIQDVAIAHWEHLASKEEKDLYFWVIIRHEIDYKRSAMLDDELIARTWVGEVKTIAFMRHTELIRKKDGKLLAKALTTWCPMNTQSKRPVKVSHEILEKFSS